MSGRPVCPQCGTAVEAHWDWCHSCGFDPEGKRPADTGPADAGPSDYRAPVTGLAFPGAPALVPRAVTPPETAPVTPPFTSQPDNGGFGSGSYDAHPYGDLPYDEEPTPPPMETAPAVPANRASSPLPRVTAAPEAPSVRPGELTAGSSAPRLGSSGPGGPSFRATNFGGATPAPSSARANAGRYALVGASCLLVAVLGVMGIVKVAGGTDSSTARTSTTLDPKAPPPLGQVGLGGSGNESKAPGNPGAVVGATYPKPTDGWFQFVTPDQTFQVDFPAAPRTESVIYPFQNQVLTALKVTFSSGTDGAGYSVVYLDLPAGALLVDSQAAVDLENDSRRRERRPLLNVVGPYDVGGGLMGVQYTIDDRGKHLNGVLVVKGTRLYTVEAIDIPDDQFARFAQSFHVLKDPVRR